MTVAEAYSCCNELTRTHYENFPVARLVPADIRPFVSAVYAFARTADDIADEGWDQSGAPTVDERIAQLEAFEYQLCRAFEGDPISGSQWDWIFIALADTANQCEVPIELFRDLLSAFRQDCRVLSYATHDEVLDYCRRSANPIGRLVLLLHGYRREDWFALSDSICTALQLANFWQDIGVDLRKDGRIYIPQEDWVTFGVERSMFELPEAPDPLRRCIAHQVERTKRLFDAGAALPRQLPFPLSVEIRLTLLGGREILRKVRRQGFDTLSRRPKLTKLDGARLLATALLPG